MATKTETKTYNPEQIAESLGISGKQVRAYLRKAYTRPTDAKGTSWVLTREQAQATIKHFKQASSSKVEDES
jgi:predicted site-specific integrase-resolvase